MRLLEFKQEKVTREKYQWRSITSMYKGFSTSGALLGMR